MKPPGLCHDNLVRSPHVGADQQWCIVALQYLQLTLFIFRSLNMSLSPFALHLYAASTCCPEMNPNVQIITFSLTDFFVIHLSWKLGTPNSEFSLLRWFWGPLCGCFPHILICCALPLPIPVHVVPPVVRRLPAAPPLPLRSTKWWRLWGKLGTIGSILSLLWMAVHITPGLWHHRLLIPKNLY